MKNTASNKDFFVFAIWFVAIFGVSFAALYTFGLVPKEVDSSGRETVLDKVRQNAIENVVSDSQDTAQIKGEMPIHLKIPSANIDISIKNPDTKDPVLLDEYLKKGIVRYPGSGLLGSGNILIFGHSSHLAVVQNPNYKALNGVENLKAGEEIFLKSEESWDYVYVYKVRSVRMAKASEIKVDFSVPNLLTISTCNNFGAEEDRHVVEAVFDRKEIPRV